MGWNPDANATVGLEWLVDTTPSSFVLDSATKAYGVVVPSRVAAETLQSVAPYAQSVSGQGVFACDVYAAPLAANVASTADINYPGTNTGKDVSSVLNGGAAWVTDSGAAASFASIDPGVDGTTYLKNVNGAENPPCWCMFAGANATQMSGKRIVSVEVHARAGGTMIGTPILIGNLRLSGTNYAGVSAAISQYNGWNDYTLGTFVVNPKTGAPWTLPDVNNLVTTGGTDLFGVQGLWEGQSAGTLQIVALYLKVTWVPEDRMGYASGTVTASGWQTWTAKSVPNLLTGQQSYLSSGTTGWTAGSNTTLSNQADRPAGWSASVFALQLSSTAAGTISAVMATKIPVTPGRIYGFYCSQKSTLFGSSAFTFYDANGNSLGAGTSQLVTAGPSGSGAWELMVIGGAATAPANAATVTITVSTTASAGAQTLRIAGMVLGLEPLANTLANAFLGATAPPQGAVEQSRIWRTNTAFNAGSIANIYVLHRTSGSGTMSIPSLPAGSSPAGMPHGYSAYRPTLTDQSGAIGTIGSAYTDTSALILTTTAPATSTDSQPYAARITGLANSANTLKSQITTPVGTFTYVRFVVSGEIDPPAANLSVKLKKSSDNSQVGGTATVLPTDLAQVSTPGLSSPSRTGAQIVVATFASNATTGAVQHYVEFTSTAASGSGWVVYALDDMGSGDSATFNGTTDGWNDPLNGGLQTRRDGMVTIQTQPATPAGLTAVAV